MPSGRMYHEKIGVMGDDAEQDGIDQSVDVDPVLLSAAQGAGAIGIRDAHAPRRPVIACQHDEMSRRETADVVRLVLWSELARRAVEMGRAEPREDGHAMAKDAPQ